MILNNSFFAQSKVWAPIVSNCFRLVLHLQKSRVLPGKFFLPKKKWLIDNFDMITPGRAHPRPPVSDCFTSSGRPVLHVDHWLTVTKISTSNTFPHDPSARRLAEMMHLDLKTQHTPKITKPQDLVKFNRAQLVSISLIVGMAKT